MSSSNDVTSIGLDFFELCMAYCIQFIPSLLGAFLSFYAFPKHSNNDNHNTEFFSQVMGFGMEPTWLKLNFF